MTSTHSEKMANLENPQLYKEETTPKGAMKIEVVLEDAKKKKRPTSARVRPGSATSIRSMEDIEKRQQVSQDKSCRYTLS